MKTITYSLLAIFLALLFSQFSIAQSNKSRKLFKEAEKQYDIHQYNDAVKTLLSVVDDEPDYHEARFLLGKSYYENYQFSLAKEQFEVLINNQNYLNDEVRYLLGMSFKAIGEYEIAKTHLENFIANTINVNLRRKAELEIVGIDMAMENKVAVNDFDFQNAGDQLNTRYGEHAVSILGSPRKIILSRYKSDDKKNSDNLKYQLNQFWLKVDDGDEFDFLNTEAIEGAGVMDSQTESYYFSSCQIYGNRCQIMHSRKENGIWLKAIPIDPAVFPSTNNYIHPKLSVNGDTLYFSSDKRGGLGGYDIWYSVIEENNHWGEPINLGEPVNTLHDEVAPFIGANGDFYFSSNGHPGYGLYDIFYAEGLNGERSIHNLGRPFNSSMDDLHFNALAGMGLLVSNRNEGFGDYDVYTFKMEVVEETQEELADLSMEDMEQLYSILFNSKLYQLYPKFIGAEFDKYSNLNFALRQDLDKRVSENYNSLANDKISSVIEDDKILLASLSRDERFFVERIAAAYFEDEKALTLQLSEEDEAYYQNLSVKNKRKLYRLSLATINDLKGEFDPLAKSREEPLIQENSKPDNEQAIATNLTVQSEGENDQNMREEATEEVLIVEESVETSKDMISQREQTAVVEEAVISKPEYEETSVETPEMVSVPSKKQARVEQTTNDEKFTSLLGVASSLEFYQNLSFTDKKRVDRIMAIRLVNEKYTLAPGLSYVDRTYYDNLPQKEKDIIDRLKLYFRSWSKDKELANLRSSDLEYLAGLEPARRDVVARIIVRRGIGVDEDQFVKFNGGDWTRYKNFSANEVEKIKVVASLLKEHQQFFDVALAYAGTDYTFNNNLAYLQTSQRPVTAYSTSSDPEVLLSESEQNFEIIYFDPGEYRLRNEALVALNELIDIYRQNPEISFALDAYSYEKGNEADNLKLSSLRTNSAKKYLVNGGIPDFKVRDHVYSVNSAVGDHTTITNLTQRKLELNILNSPIVFESNYTTYLVQPGNTLYSLSKANSMSVDELMAINGLHDYKILAYQPLRVKADATLDPDFMVEKSDIHVKEAIITKEESQKTSDKLVQREIVESDKVNESGEADDFERGEEQMVINVTEEPETKTVIYIVRKGDKIEEVAAKYNTSVESILTLNGLKKKKIKKGQKLTIEEVINP